MKHIFLILLVAWVSGCSSSTLPGDEHKTLITGTDQGGEAIIRKGSGLTIVEISIGLSRSNVEIEYRKESHEESIICRKDGIKINYYRKSATGKEEYGDEDKTKRMILMARFVLESEGEVVDVESFLK